MIDAETKLKSIFESISNSLRDVQIELALLPKRMLVSMLDIMRDEDTPYGNEIEHFVLAILLRDIEIKELVKSASKNKVMEEEDGA